MDEQTFKRQIEADGYDQAAMVEWEPGTFNDTHTHDFSAALLVLSGEITVKTDAGETTCRAEDTFSLAAGVPHSETIGADGVRFLVGRK
jgi:quercetin dioxygenase-like cupin family protein